MRCVIMGPSGAGKTTVGQAVAAALGGAFLDADDFHSPAAKEKMAAGVGLNDADREPWLKRVRLALEAASSEGPVVLACSALARRYRVALGIGANTSAPALVYLAVPAETLAARLESRQGHFARSSLVASQLATLEPPGPGEALCLDGTSPIATLTREISEWLRAGAPAKGGDF
jgi:gluconokinase